MQASHFNGQILQLTHKDYCLFGAQPVIIPSKQIFKIFHLARSGAVAVAQSIER